MSMSTIVKAFIGLAALIVLMTMPLVLTSDYHLSIGITLLQFAIMATAWAMFSGPTRYISLATGSFFGIGAYTTAVLADYLPWPAILVVALVIGLVCAALVGLSTLRLSGVYFVIFSFGLSELIRQLVSWYEVNVTRTSARYIFLDITSAQIYWQLAALLAILFLVGIWIKHSRLGTALRMIGEDEIVAKHIGINTTRVKVMLFAISSSFITLTGAIIAPRWTYLDPGIAFNANISFQVLIMALLGGVSSLFGPILGVVPLVLVIEYLSANFPNHFSILVGAIFMIVVYFIPDGIVGLLSHGRQRTSASNTHTDVSAKLEAQP
ncbi:MULTISPECIES: branched-chain amino acid ABC transporter permease [Hyphomicrobiales]|uniref:Branched-chain amino acid transport system permease protein n=2 Tax=Hyphomicrobiales TaxID=356 RepID=A0A285V2K1_9HYPH|nr:MULTISPECIES: branched-chain amino acid ABC transporter permease [Hyphomicrobiales]KAB0564644.1 branched-chain amino acid ABC transporter permease [Brucella pituitosa]SOC48385.1 branched-chain amino acid transport system permease protein [Rhizobium subbaraonis]